MGERVDCVEREAVEHQNMEFVYQAMTTSSQIVVRVVLEEDVFMFEFGCKQSESYEHFDYMGVVDAYSPQYMRLRLLHFGEHYNFIELFTHEAVRMAVHLNGVVQEFSLTRVSEGS